MFRNESIDVIRKAKAKAASKDRSTPPGPKASTQVVEQDTKESLMLVPRKQTHTPPSSTSYRSLAPTIDELATGFFSANYILGIDRCSGNSAGYRIDDNLADCMKAVGLAALASAAHAPELVKEAKKRYLSAIQLTNAALGSGVVKNDSTLLAIMLLSIFETLTSNEQRSLSAWSNHIDGAAALIKIRGAEQLTRCALISSFPPYTLFIESPS